jgi:adenylate cyclase
MVRASDFLGARILVVDDQEANVTLLELMLQEAGYTAVDSTRDPREVCPRHQRNRYDLILLDLQMPGMDGFQVMEGLKEIETGGYLPVLVITAQPDHKLRALKAGAKDFVSKPLDLAEVLARVRNMLEVRLLHRETKQLYERVLAEQRLSERLLLNVLPPAIARRLKGRPDVVADDFTEIIADSFAEVTVLFADIVSFTRFSEGVRPEEMVGILNEIFSRYDNIADRWGIEKIKTIGDAYMAAAGLPVPVPDHADRMAHMALDMREVMEHYNRQSRYKLEIRIGLSSGAAVAGVIGKRKFIYDLWGDVVNTANRMESHGVPGQIQVSDATRRRLSPSFVLEKRGLISVKNKGDMLTWFLHGRTEADRQVTPSASGAPADRQGADAVDA